MTRLPLDKNGIIYRSSAIRAGFTDEEIRQARRRKEIVRLSRGRSVPRGKRKPEEWHRLWVLAVAAAVAEGAADAGAADAEESGDATGPADGGIAVAAEELADATGSAGGGVAAAAEPSADAEGTADSVAAAPDSGSGAARSNSLAQLRVGEKTRQVVSHQSAAIMLGLEMLEPSLSRVHFTTARRSGGHRSTKRHVHVGVLPDDQIVVVDGVEMTSLERTAVDVACASPRGFAGALAVFDSALRLGAKRELIDELLKERRVGVTHARRAWRFADGSSENPGESWGRAQMIEAGLPIPRLQQEFFDDDGTFIARTDYDWKALLVGEFDGKDKYLKDLRPGETPADAVMREKKREDRLRGRGVMVIRWDWADLVSGAMITLVRKWLTELKLIGA